MFNDTTDRDESLVTTEHHAALAPESCDSYTEFHDIDRDFRSYRCKCGCPALTLGDLESHRELVVEQHLTDVLAKRSA